MKDVEQEVIRMINRFDELDNNAFVAFVRRMEQKNPEWLTLSSWQHAVEREIGLRNLLK